MLLLLPLPFISLLITYHAIDFIKSASTCKVTRDSTAAFNNKFLPLGNISYYWILHIFSYRALICTSYLTTSPFQFEFEFEFWKEVFSLHSYKQIHIFYSLSSPNRWMRLVYPAFVYNYFVCMIIL